MKRNPATTKRKKPARPRGRAGKSASSGRPNRRAPTYREAKAALDRIGEASKAAGLDKMTLKEINAEIRAYRRERDARAARRRKKKA